MNKGAGGVRNDRGDDATLEEEKAILEDIEMQLAEYGTERKYMIPILQMIQERHQYLPPDAIQMVGRHLGISPSEVYGVATFYNQFRFHPPGRHPIKVCLGTACHVKGGDIILENFERKLEIKDGETTPDREFSIERVACVGCCALAPVAVVNETVHGNMAPSKVEGLILRVKLEKEKAAREKEKSPSHE
jgi:NADH-quinone oxidoreductase subunit E